MSAHTPAPWLIIEPSFIYALNDDGTNRFDAYLRAGELSHDKHGQKRDRTSNEELLANTKLMAAAPDLLAALIFTINDLRLRAGLAEDGVPELNVSNSVLDAICDAIAKATGGEP